MNQQTGRESSVSARALYLSWLPPLHGRTAGRFVKPQGITGSNPAAARRFELLQLLLLLLLVLLPLLLLLLLLKISRGRMMLRVTGYRPG